MNNGHNRLIALGLIALFSAEIIAMRSVRPPGGIKIRKALTEDQRKAFHAGIQPIFFIYEEKTHDGARITKDVVLQSKTLKTLLEDMNNPTTASIPLENFSADTIKKAFSILEKFTQAQNTLTDEIKEYIASLRPKPLIETTNCLHYLDVVPALITYCTKILSTKLSTLSSKQDFDI